MYLILSFTIFLTLQIALVTFTPAHESQVGLFQEYIKYFLERERAGVISLPNYSLYLLPPCEKAFAIYKFGYNELLGILVDNKEIQSGTYSFIFQRKYLLFHRGFLTSG